MPAPSDSPSSTLPALTNTAISTCPVTLHNGKSPSEHYCTSDSCHGNDDGTLFTGLWPGGKVIFTPNGSGAQNSDGSLGTKWFWYRMIEGDVVISGKRLDAPAPAMPTVVLRGREDGYGETGFHAGGLLFPSEGCWEVAGRVGDESLTLVTLVARLDFDTPQFHWWPVGALGQSDTDLSAYPGAARQIWTSPAGGEITIETRRGSAEGPVPPPGTASLPVVVRGNLGLCLQGDRDDMGQVHLEVDAGWIEWNADGISYRISHMGMGLNCFDLLRMAGSYFLPG